MTRGEVAARLEDAVGMWHIVEMRCGKTWWQQFQPGVPAIAYLAHEDVVVAPFLVLRLREALVGEERFLAIGEVVAGATVHPAIDGTHEPLHRCHHLVEDAEVLPWPAVVAVVEMRVAEHHVDPRAKVAHHRHEPPVAMDLAVGINGENHLILSLLDALHHPQLLA